MELHTYLGVLKNICGVSGRKANGDPIWLKVGVLLEGKNGKQMLSFNRAYNLAGLEYNPEFSNDVILHLFDVNNQTQQQTNNAPVAQPRQAHERSYTEYKPKIMNHYDEDLPF